jgi:hypothetical protein
MPGKSNQVIKYILIAEGLFLAGWALYLWLNYQQLSEGEGWGVVGMLGILFWEFIFFIVVLIIGWLLTRGRSR